MAQPQASKPEPAQSSSKITIKRDFTVNAEDLTRTNDAEWLSQAAVLMQHYTTLRYILVQLPKETQDLLNVSLPADRSAMIPTMTPTAMFDTDRDFSISLPRRSCSWHTGSALQGRPHVTMPAARRDMTILWP